MRKAFAETLYELAKNNPRLIFLTGDLGFQVFNDFERDFKNRFINVGVAEAQLISAAAGLALEKWYPIVYSIASFATARPFEQIRFCVGYHHLPVMIVGAGRSFTYSTSGVSHHATDDIGLMSLIPGMTIVIPGDGNEVKQLMSQLLQVNGPTYFTIGRYGEPTYEAEEPAVLGKARLLRKGHTVAIFSTGEITYEVMQAMKLLEAEGLSPSAYQIHTVKPLDIITLNKVAKEAHTFIVVDEHLPNGSIWGLITAWNVETGCPVRLRRLGPSDSFALGNVQRDDLRRSSGYDAVSIAEACRAAWNSR